MLTHACHDNRRAVDDIEITLSTHLAPHETSEAIVERCTELSHLGVDHVVLATTGPWTIPDIDIVSAAVGPPATIPRRTTSRDEDPTTATPTLVRNILATLAQVPKSAEASMQSSAVYKARTDERTRSRSWHPAPHPPGP